MKQVSKGFQLFMQEGGKIAEAEMSLIRAISEESTLEPKVQELAYLAVLAAIGNEGGIPFHVKSAKEKGASRDEIKSAVLCGMPLKGITLLSPLETALSAFDEEASCQP